MNKLLGSAGIVAIALACQAAPASAASLVFDLSNAGTRVNDQTRTFSAGTGTNTVNVRATAWSLLNGTTLSAAMLDSWNEGLGVRNPLDGSHTVDNLGSKDFIVFHFDKQVELDTARLTPFDVQSGMTKDNDFSVARATLGTAWSAGLNSSVISQLTASVQSYSGTGSSQAVDLNPSNALGNVWLVGADFRGLDNRYDGFKIDQLKVTTPVTPAVPEPATWAMMIGGLGMVGGAMRASRRRTRVAFAA